MAKSNKGQELSKGSNSSYESIAEAAKAGSDAYSTSLSRKLEKEKRLAELLNAALGRQKEVGEGMRQRGSDLARSRAQNMQSLASQYIQALRK